MHREPEVGVPREAVGEQEVRKYLLEPGGLTERTVEQALAGVWSRACSYADVYLQHIQSETLTIEDGVVRGAGFDLEQGMGVRAVVGEKSGFAYSEEVTPKQLQQAARAARSIADGNRQARLPATSTGHPPSICSRAHPLQEWEMKQRMHLLHCVDQAARAVDPRICSVRASLSGRYEVVLVASTDGIYQADVRPLVRLDVRVIARQGDRIEEGGEGGGGRHGYGVLLADGAAENLAGKAARAALLNLEAQPAPAGPMTVVLGPGWPGVLLHEAVGHGLEGDAVRKDLSVFAGRMGERVAAPGVTVVDDGTLADRRGSLCIDDEGTPTARTVLIEDGILRGYMYDRLNARLCGAAPTGNGRRESYAYQPMPRMTNTYMLAGTHDPQEILASVDHGLYAVGFQGGQVDTTSGKFVFSMSEAYRIEGGRITSPVKGATLIGDGASVLERVRMVGTDLQLDGGIGTCGKDGQQVPVGVGQPTVRVDDLTVGGTHAAAG